MKTIYKYPVSGQTIRVARMPFEAKVLTCQLQGGNLSLWAEVDDDVPANTDTYVLVVGTGMGFPCVDMDDYRYLSTVQDGPLVWHIYIEDLNAKEPFKIVWK